jgi:hypothetical protein
MAKTVFEERKAEIAESGEDDRTGKKDLETVEVEAIELRRQSK